MPISARNTFRQNRGSQIIETKYYFEINLAYKKKESVLPRTQVFKESLSSPSPNTVKITYARTRLGGKQQKTRV